ncbi:hypothetical protein ALC56_02141 [Trachymyrmex septentrionalis]|uniref:Uncharacterized protein n=1 Tax=Trachymyrmex septentrionalis TaxID=34720 RepID=A0A195FS26_9HYME|nr:hypothetical protein ALC56_02141 [Trachymyrmex septentrionalis]
MAACLYCSCSVLPVHSVRVTGTTTTTFGSSPSATTTETTGTTSTTEVVLLLLLLPAAALRGRPLDEKQSSLRTLRSGFDVPHSPPVSAGGDCGANGRRRGGQLLISSHRGGHDYFKGFVPPWRPGLSAPSRQREAPATGNGPADHQCSQVRRAKELIHASLLPIFILISTSNILEKIRLNDF